MIDEIKKRIAKVIINRSLKENTGGKRSFTNFYKKSFNILIIMPEDEFDFNHSFAVLKYIEESKKNPVILTYDYRVSLIPAKYRPRVIEHTINDMNKLNLPSKRLIEKISEGHYHAAIDLNRKESVFYGYLFTMINAPLKIGFKKENSDKYYNVQIVNNESSPEESYKNLLNCLQMF
jgi:ADP-heptose:LPS heptosyltransferase